MALKVSERAPYATAKTIITVLEKHRSIRLNKIDSTLLDRIGVTESLMPRTLSSLAILDFTDDDGNPTPEFQRLPSLTDEDFKSAVADMLRSAYAPVLEIIGDPAQVSQKDIENAFRGFTPTGQIDRMVQLFIGLMAYVGLMPEPSRRKQAAPTPLSRPATRTPNKVTPLKKPPKGAQDHPAEAPEQQPPPPKGGEYSQSVQLAGDAGTVTLSVNVNPMKLKGAVREFFYSLVDAMDDYDQKTSGSE